MRFQLTRVNAAVAALMGTLFALSTWSSGIREHQGLGVCLEGLAKRQNFVIVVACCNGLLSTGNCQLIN